MKKIMCLVCTVALLAATLSMAGCMGGFFEEDELMIASIDHELLDSGLTKVIITYTDDTVEPTILYLPKGDTGEIGKTGNGIKEILYTHNDVEHRTDVTIHYTNAETPAVSFSIPDGLSVTGIEEGVHSITGEKYIVFRYSDGTPSQEITLPKGDKGEDGNGISSFETVVNDDRSISVSITFTKSDPISFTIPAPLDGVDGNGIEDMWLDESGGTYTIFVKYTDEEDPVPFRFARPNQWYSSAEDPASEVIVRDGDYWFDTSHETIKYRKNGIWTTVISFRQQSVTCRVTFDLNDDLPIDGAQASMPGMDWPFVDIEKGQYFSANGHNPLPVPTRAGYTFGGWYTSKTPNLYTMGTFTDVTPVFSDITLYAYWIPTTP